MIVPKKILIAVALLLSTIVFSYFFRVAIVKSVIKDELALYQANIACLDFHLTTSLDLSIDKLCLRTAQAEINIEDMAIAFELVAEQKIKHINIASVTVKGTTALFSQLKNNQQKNNHATIIKQLDSYLTQLEQLNLPFDINVAALHYLPFTCENNKKSTNAEPQKTSRYLAQLSVIKNSVKFSLKDQQQSTFLAFSTNKAKKSPLMLNISAQLTPLKRFLLAHKLLLTPAILELLARLNISGDFHSLLSYQAGQLTLASQLKDFAFTTVQGIQASGPFELTGALNIHGEVNVNQENKAMNSYAELVVEFQQKNALLLQYSHQHLLDYLSKNVRSSELFTLLIDNPIEQLTLHPKGKLIYHLNDQQVFLSGIALKAESAQQTHLLNLDNIALDLKHYLTSDLSHAITFADNSLAKNVNLSANDIAPGNAKKHGPNESAALIQLDFKLDSSLLLSTLNSFTHSPVEFKLQGGIKLDHCQTTIHFDQDSFFISDNIEILAKQKTTEKNRFTVKQLKTQIQGDIEIQDKQSIFLNLTIDSQAKKLRVDNMIEVKNLTLNSNISGNLNDIKIEATATADNIPLGNIVIIGALDKPNIAITAKALPLTELLSLNIKLPTKIDLVEGTLSYSIEGSVTDLTNLQSTHLAMSVAITSASGEVAGIWIQELNWQQNFNFIAGKFTTQDSSALGSKDNSKDNLTVALIDIPTPISKLSISTAWHYQKDFKISATTLKGDILGGSFSIPKIQWPLEHGHSVDVQLTSIDLEQVLALDKKQGIVVTGKISGQLPISYNGKKFTMEKGELHNVSNGLIQVINNPAVQEIKASNTQLQLAFDALQNLHYHQLSSDVSMADDGYMLLKTVIKGRNPDIDNDVNLNLNLSYDLLGLLESMAITGQFEDRIIKGLQKNIKE